MNCWDGSIFPVVPFLFSQIMCFKTALAQSSGSCNDSPFSFNNIGLFDYTTPFPMAVTIWQLIAVPAACVPIIIVLTLAIRSSESRFGWPFRLKRVFPSSSFLILNFQLLMGVPRKYTLDKFYWNVRVQLWFHKSEHIFQPLFWSFLGH